MTEVRDGSGNGIASYYYNRFGRRLWKDVDGTRTYFLYADEGLIGEYDSLGTQTTAYGYIPNSTWGLPTPLFMKQAGEYFFCHNDHLGTPQKMTSINGASVWSATHESFGMAVIDPASTITNNLRFPGQYYDQETGLHYNYHRYYDPTSGRYLRTDPIGFNGGFNFTSMRSKIRSTLLIRSVCGVLSGRQCHFPAPKSLLEHQVTTDPLKAQ